MQKQIRVTLILLICLATFAGTLFASNEYTALFQDNFGPIKTVKRITVDGTHATITDLNGNETSGDACQLLGCAGSTLIIENFKITATDIGPEEACIRLKNRSNIIVRHNFIGPCSGTTKWIERAWAILATGNGNTTSISVEENKFREIEAGVRLDRLEGGASISKNTFYELDTTVNLKTGVISLKDVRGAGNRIEYNQIIISTENCSKVAYDNPDFDTISVYNSRGTAASPIQIVENRVHGSSCPSAPPPGRLRSGAGIIVDGKCVDLSGGNGALDPNKLCLERPQDHWNGYIHIKNNTLVNAGPQQTIVISGGRNIAVEGNRIYTKSTTYSNPIVYSHFQPIGMSDYWITV